MAFKDAVLADEPSAYFRLGETGGTSAADQQGGAAGAYTGGFTLGQTGLITGDSDKAVKLDGTSGYIAVGDRTELDLGDTFTIEAIIELGELGRVNCIVDKGTSAYLFEVYKDNYLYLEKTGGPILAKSKEPLAANTRYHVVATKTGGSKHLYINGVDVTGTTVSATCEDNATALDIGRVNGVANFFKGKLDEIAVYKHVLSEDRIKAHFAWITGGPPINTKAPEVKGTPKVGQTLEVTNGEWEHEPTSYAYQWELEAGSGWVKLLDETASTYMIKERDRGRTVRCIVTAQNDSGTGEKESSASGEVPGGTVGIHVKRRALNMAGKTVIPTMPDSHTEAIVFEGNSISEYFLQEVEGAITEVPDPLGSGQTVFEFSVSNADVAPETPTKDPRAQAAAPQAGVDNYAIPDGAEVWISGAFLLPESFPSSLPSWFQFVQVFGLPFAGSAPWALKIGDANGLCWQRNATYGFDIPWETGTIPRGAWITWLIHYKHAATGFVEMWIDGTQVTFFKAGSSYNPNKEAETTKLAMETMDATNNGAANAVFLQSYRELDMLEETVVMYHKPLILKAA